MRLPATPARVFKALVSLCALSLFAWVAAHWIWRATENSASPTVVPQRTDWSARILSDGALGFTQATPAPAMPAAAPGVVEGRIRLMGIARHPGTRERSAAQALFKIDGKRILWLHAGEEVDPGITLVAVEADGVRLARDGREVQLPLRPRLRPPSPAALSAAASTASKGSPTVAAATCRLAPEQRSRAYVLRPEIVEGVMRERSGWTDMFKSVPEGLQVQNPGGTGAMLGLYGNDMLSKADGARLSGHDDVLRLILQPLVRNESVVVTGSRGGQPREWIYAGMNCLPR
jgi:hypothetical protein